MMTIYVQRGDSVDYTPDDDVDAGDVIVIGPNLIGIAKLDIAAGELGALSLVGVYDMPKATGTGEDIQRGVNIYWDSSEQIVTTDNSKIYLGATITEAGENDETIRVHLLQ